MIKPDEKPLRRTFIMWAAGLFAGLALFRGLSKEKPKPRTAKFLTEDGKLVEVDLEKIHGGRKIVNEELKNWVKK